MCHCDDTWIYVLMFTALAQHSPNEVFESETFSPKMEHLQFFLFFFLAFHS